MLCPICKKPVEEPGRNPHPGEASATRSYFPFCSERCKLIDLGRWLGGKYQVPVIERDESDEDAPPTSESPPSPRR